MTHCTAFPLMPQPWHTKICSVVLTDADAVRSLWNGHLYIRHPLSSTHGSPPYAIKSSPIEKTGHSFSSLSRECPYEDRNEGHIPSVH